MSLHLIKRPIKKLLANPWLGRLVRIRKPATFVLCYHDVCQQGHWPSWPRIEASVLDAQLAHLGKLGTFIGPDQVLESDHRGIQILLTFDDGYASHLGSVLPILHKHAAPAVFFISTWNVQTGEPHWFDRVEMAVRNQGAKDLDLTEYGLGQYSLSNDGPEPWWRDFDVILRDIKSAGNEDHPTVRGLIHRLEQQEPVVSSTRKFEVRPLDRDELRKLAKDPLAHIGSHGHNHRVMTRMDLDQVMDQMTTSKDLLEDWLDAPVMDVAYPNGECDEQVQAAAIRAGYIRGFSVGDGLLFQKTSATAIPRYLVGAFDSGPKLGLAINETLLRGRRK